MNQWEIPTPDRSIGRHLLSIEGRGICGLTALITLKEVLRQYQYSQKLPQLPRPYDVFDLAGGAGTGGVIAIMLFRLGMTVDEAITAFTSVSEDVFAKKTVLHSKKKTYGSRLEDAIKKVIHSSLNIDRSQAQRICMLDDKGSKCFVMASTPRNLSSPTLFRTYVSPRHASYNCTIVEAIRATTAEGPFFPSIEIGDIKETFINVGSGINNPVKAVLEEAMSIFPDQRISCVLSIGSGAQGVTGFESTSTTELARVLKKVVNDGERISDEVAKELCDKGVFYCRLNVDHGLDDIGFEDWARLGDVGTHTRKYLERHETTQRVSRLVEVLDLRTAIATSIEKTLMVLSQFLDSWASSVHCVPDDSWSRVIPEFFAEGKQHGKMATETLNMQCALLRDTLESCTHGNGFAELPEELKRNIRQLLEGVRKVFRDSPRQDDPLAYINRKFQKLLQRFWVQNHIAGNMAVHKILNYIQRDDPMKRTFTRLEQHAINQNLKDLNVAPSAAYDSFEVSEKAPCFKGTRVGLLNEIAGWVADDKPSLPPIYVLDGVAGIGKSTIAKTVAEHAAEINTLGASFFFSRNDDKRKTVKTFFPTIAAQLAYFDMDFADRINMALLHNPHAATKAPPKQFSTLIMEPLKKPLAMSGNPILIVIDALDECQHDADAILKIFADSIKYMPRLKLFITTRPEYHIRNVLDRYHHLKRFHLQDIEKSVVQSDIRLYLEFYLSENELRDKFPGLQLSRRPAKKDMELLIETCGTLFIIASTAVKFILGNKRSNPAKQLSRLLKGVSHLGSNHTTVMDSIYTQILVSASPDDGDEDEEWFEHYQIVVGAIVTLQYPLPCVTLSALIGLVPDDVKCALSHLHSLVAPTGQDTTFRTYHKSFPDFVTSPSRCERRFLIDLKTSHLELGKRCLKIMDSQLKSNICNLDPADRFRDNTSYQHLTQDYISQELAYASTHWATHLFNATKIDDDTEKLLEDFARKHLLSWLEVLSIIQQVEIAYSSLDRISKLLIGCKTTAGITHEILHDGCRFIALNFELIKVAAGHVFSALAFVPQDTRLFRTYRGVERINLDLNSGYEKAWNPTISIMTGHESNVNSIAFSGDGTKLVSASTDWTVRLWDGQTGAEIAVLRGHSKTINMVVFSPDGTKVASASHDEMVRLWDVQTGAEISILRGHRNEVYSVVFSPEGSKLASGSLDGTVRLWDGETGAKIAVLEGHSNTVKSVVFSADGKRLASASFDGTVRLWDGQTGAKIGILEGHSDWVVSVVFSADSTRLASASVDRTVRVWHGQTGSELAVLQGHTNRVNSSAFSPDSARLASTSEDWTVRLWNVQECVLIAVLQGHSNSVNSAVFSSNGMKLASGSRDGTVRLWDGQTGAAFAVLQGHSDSVKSVSFALDGTRLASASDDGTVRLWDSQTGIKTAFRQGYSHLVNLLEFSPDGTKLSSASDDGTVRLWDQTGDEIAILRGHLFSVNSVAFSPDGTKLVSGSVDCTVRLWNSQTGSELAVLEGHSRSVSAVVFSPDGKKLASTSSDETVRIWDVNTGTEIAVFRGHSNSVNSATFSPDGTKLASASFDRTVRLWDSHTGAEIATLQGHSNWVTSAMFSSDGTRLASVDVDEEVQLWDGQSGAQIANFPKTALVGFRSDDSGLLLIDDKEVYQVNSAGDRVAIPLGIFIDSIVEAVRVLDLNLWVVRVVRKQPRLSGLLVVKVDMEDVLCFTSLCWFPPNLPVNSLAVSSLSRVAIGCRDGRILLLDADLSSLL